METNRFLKVVIIALLLVNIGTLTFIWMQGNRQHGGPPPPPPQGEGRGVFEFLTHELQLDNQQQQQYESLRDEHHRAVEELQMNSREIHQQYFELLHGANTDSAQVNLLADSLAHIQKQIDLITFYHFQKVRSICKPEQQKRFDEVINEALRMMAPPPPPRR